MTSHQKNTQQNKQHTSTRLLATTLMAIAISIVLTGCNSNLKAPGSKEGLMYQQAVAKLNQKAQTMMNGGDSNGAVCRLESALDLLPEEPQTMANLAIAYHTAERYPQAIELYGKLLEKDAAKAGFYHKFSGVSNEAMGDKLMSLVSDPAIASQAPENRKGAIAAYQEAIKHYRSALSAMDESPDKSGLSDENPQTIEAQITNLETQIKRISTGEG